jgi:competence protein ComEC
MEKCLDQMFSKLVITAQKLVPLMVFLKLVNPEIAVVSVGYRNKFRHPSNDVLERISQYAEKIHRTDQSGALWLRSNGSEIWEVSWK